MVLYCWMEEQKKAIALSKTYDHVIVGGNTSVSFSTLLVQSHMFMKTAVVSERERFMDISFTYQ